uniref:Uncharacterized protein n=1 Tax=Amphimedon queenslandica TaxID=400682 RepID=A0A1X7V407_AMPQE
MSVENRKFCPEKENPADTPSRGSSPTELHNNGLWRNGPSWLGNEIEDIQCDEMPTESQILKAVKRFKKENTTNDRIEFLSTAENMWLLEVQSNLTNRTDFTVLKRQLDLYCDETGIL